MRQFLFQQQPLYGPVGAIGMGATLVGAFVGAAGDLWAGAAKSAAAKYQAGLAYQRAQVEAENQRQIFSATESKAYQTGTAGAVRVGALAAGQGASNIALTSPSSADVRASQTRAVQIAESGERTTGARQIRGSQIAQAADVAQAHVEEAEAQTDITASKFAAAGDLLKGFGSAAASFSPSQAPSTLGSADTSVDPKWAQVTQNYWPVSQG